LAVLLAVLFRVRLSGKPAGQSVQKCVALHTPTPRQPRATNNATHFELHDTHMQTNLATYLKQDGQISICVAALLATDN
jgi:hypothetical protein